MYENVVDTCLISCLKTNIQILKMSTIFLTLHFGLIIYLLVIFMVGIYGNRIYLDITKLANVGSQSIGNLSSAMKSFMKYNTFHENVEPVFIYYESRKLSGLLIVSLTYFYHFLNTYIMFLLLDDAKDKGSRKRNFTIKRQRVGCDGVKNVERYATGLYGQI